MNNLNYNQALAFCRSELKKLGMQVVGGDCYIYGRKSYSVVKKDSGSVVDKNFTLWMLYENVNSGFFDSKKEVF